MNKPRRRYSMQEKLDILYEADQHGLAHIQSMYGLSPGTLFRWEKDLKNSRTRQAAINKQNDAQAIESLKAEVEQLKKVIASQTPLLQSAEQKPQVIEPTINEKEDELYRLVASLIVRNLLNDEEEDSDNNRIPYGK